MRVLVYTLVSGIEHAGMDDTRVTTAYISLDDIKQNSAFMTFARHHLPSGVGHISSVYKRDAEEYGTSYRWFSAVNDSPVDFDLEEEGHFYLLAQCMSCTLSHQRAHRHTTHQANSQPVLL